MHDLVRESIRDRLSPAGAPGAVCRASCRPPTRRRSSIACCRLSSRCWRRRPCPDISPRARGGVAVAAADDASARLTHEAAGRHFQDAAALTDDPDGAGATDTAERSTHITEPVPSASPATVTPACSRSLTSRPGPSALLGLHRLGDPAAIGESSDLVRQLDAIDGELPVTHDTALRAEVLAARSRSRAHLLADDRSDAGPMAAEALAAGPLERATTSRSRRACSPTTTSIWEPGTEDERQSVADELGDDRPPSRRSGRGSPGSAAADGRRNRDGRSSPTGRRTRSSTPSPRHPDRRVCGSWPRPGGA